jgi:two-component system response regulator SaeR
MAWGNNEIRMAPKIFVVDDEVDTTNLVSLVLRRAGYKVYSATDFDGVMNQLRTFEETGEKIDLVILDIMMPERSGFDVMLVMQAVMHPVPPVIFLTAKIGIEDMVKASEMGAARYITKPTTPDKLVLVVREVLEKVK